MLNSSRICQIQFSSASKCLLQNIRRQILVLLILIYSASVFAQNFILLEKDSVVYTQKDRFNEYHYFKDSTSRIKFYGMSYGDITCNFSLEKLSVKFPNRFKRKMSWNYSIDSATILFYDNLDKENKVEEHPKCSKSFHQLRRFSMVGKVIQLDKRTFLFIGIYNTRFHKYKYLYIVRNGLFGSKLLTKVSFRTICISQKLFQTSFIIDKKNRKILLDHFQSDVDCGVVVLSKEDSVNELVKGKKNNIIDVNNFYIINIPKSNYNKDEIINELNTNFSDRIFYEISY